MADKTIEAFGTEVEIRETDDGFEAVEVEDEPDEGLYLRATENDDYGCEIPLDADYNIVQERSDCMDTNKVWIAWWEDDDISDMYSDGASKAKNESDKGYDGHAVVEDVEIVEY